MVSKVTQAVLLVFFLTWIRGSPVEQQSKYVIKNLQSPRIVGGEDAPYGYAKHMVGLLIGEYIKWFTCGGSIITKKHVLTAAHCVDTNVIWGELLPSFHGVIGTDYWNRTDNILIYFKAFNIHPGWSWVTLKNDIAILTTVNEMQFSHGIGDIKLNFGWSDGRIPSFVTGWGNLELFGQSPERLQILRLSTLSIKECLIRWWLAGIMDGGSQGPPPYDPALEICTLYSQGRGLCHGDSGSALVDQNTGKQTGIVSWGWPCARGAPDFYVRISAFEDFVRKSVGGYL